MAEIGARRSALALLLAATLLSGCDTGPVVYDSEAEVREALYVHPGQPSIALFTMVNNRSNEGAHSGLMVNGSHRVVFDPAGSFHHPQMPQRADLHYGLTPGGLAFYIDYHARETYHVVMQEVPVTLEQANAILRLVEAEGPVPAAACTSSIMRILRQVPGFEGMPQVLFPHRARGAFAELPGVVTTTHYDDSPDKRGDLIKIPNIR